MWNPALEKETHTYGRNVEQGERTGSCGQWAAAQMKFVSRKGLYILEQGTVVGRKSQTRKCIVVCGLVDESLISEDRCFLRTRLHGSILLEETGTNPPTRIPSSCNPREGICLAWRPYPSGPNACINFGYEGSSTYDDHKIFGFFDPTPGPSVRKM